MNGPNDHVIGARVLQLRIDREAAAPALAEQAAELWRARLAADAERLFTTRCPPETRVRLDRIELTLGTIAEAAFAEEFPARFRAALETELLRQLAQLRAGSAAPGVSTPAGRGTLDLLEHLLLHGTMPWWGPVETDYEPARELADELRRAPAPLAALARKIGRHARVRFRLIHWLADPELAALIRAVAGGDAEFVLRYAADLAARQEEARIVAATAAEFRHAKWEVILAHLLADRGSRFNTKSFLRRTLEALAGRFRMSYAALLGELTRAAERSGLVWREASLPLLLEEIYTEDVLDAGEPPATPAAWGLAWRLALRQPAAQWTAHRREQLAFWRGRPAATVAEIAAAVRGEIGAEPLEAALAALGSPAAPSPGADTMMPPAPGDAARLAAGETALAADARIATAKDGTAVEADQTDAADWLARWRDYFEKDDPASTPDACAALAYWRTLSEEKARAMTEQLVREFGRAAVARVLARLPDAPEPPADPGAPSDEVVIAALRGLLHTGALPAAGWAARWQARREAWLRLVLVTRPEIVTRLLRAWAQAGPLTTAIAEHFSDAAIESIVETVEPAHAEEVVEFVRRTNRALPDAPAGAEGPAVRGSAEAFRRGTWTVVLDYLLADRGSVFNTRSFLEYSVDALAARHGWAAVPLVELLAGHAAFADRPGLLADLRAIRERRRRRDRSRGEVPPAERAEGATSAGTVARPAGDAEDALPTTTLAWLRLLGRVLAGEPATERRLPALWAHFTGAGRDEAWAEIVRREAPSARVLRSLVATEGEGLLVAALFAGEPAQAELWRAALAWLETSAVAAGLFPGDRSGLRARLWAAALAEWRAEGGRPIRDAGELLARVLCRLQRGDRGAATGGTVETMLEALATALAGDATTDAGRLADAVRRTRARKPAPAARPVAAVPERDERPAADEAETPSASDEPIAVTNAGLVLLAPFFPELHKRCGFLADGLFSDFEANQRAVHLLQYLVNGGVRTHEYSLVLNKVLCGLDPAAPVVPEVTFDEPVAATAGALLENVVKQWPRGATISVDGLRHSYLCRPGRLQRIERGWLLKVETRGWDVLLAELPWSFGRVKAAWMPEPLTVDWV